MFRVKHTLSLIYIPIFTAIQEIFQNNHIKIDFRFQGQFKMIGFIDSSGNAVKRRFLENLDVLSLG